MRGRFGWGCQLPASSHCSTHWRLIYRYGGACAIAVRALEPVLRERHVQRRMGKALSCGESIVIKEWDAKRFPEESGYAPTGRPARGGPDGGWDAYSCMYLVCVRVWL